METIKLKIETVNAVLNYLVEQPFKNVAQLITNIQKEAKELNEMEKSEEQ